MGVAARRARGGAGRAGDELLRRRRCSRSATPRSSRSPSWSIRAEPRARSSSGRSSCSATTTSRCWSAGSWCCSRSPSPASARWRPAGGRWRWWRSAALAGVGVLAVALSESTAGRGVPAAGRRLRHLAGRPRPAHRRLAQASRPGARWRAAGSRRGFLLGPAAVGGARARARRAGPAAWAAAVARSRRARRLLRLPGVTEPRVPPAPGRARRRVAVADAGRRLLPDRHRDRDPDDRAGGVAAADPRHGRARDDAVASRTCSTAS